MAELAFEYLLAALESTRGTAINPPTHRLNMAGSLAPKKARYRPDENQGTLAEYYRSVDVRKWSEFEAEGGLDVYVLPVLLNAIVKGAVSTPTTPSGATSSRLWTFTPTMNSDDLQALTVYWGDPNVQAFQAAYAMLDELTISGDASGTDGVTLKVSGQARFPAKTAPSSVPAMLSAPLLAPGAMQLWIDTSSAIGTTEITGRVISAEVTIPSGITRKWQAAGVANDLQFSRIGRGKRHAEARIVFEMLDATQYDLWVAATSLKTRIRFNGGLIETGFYHYVEVDVYGPLDVLDWGELEGTNRTIEATILSEYNATAATDFAVRVQNNRVTL